MKQSPDERVERVARDEVLRFLDEGFRNIDLLPLTESDIGDVQSALEAFASGRAKAAIEALQPPELKDDDPLPLRLAKASQDVCGSPLEEAAPIAALLHDAAQALGFRGFGQPPEPIQDAREQFLALVADAGGFTLEYDGDETGDCSTFTITTGSSQLRDLIDVLGIPDLPSKDRYMKGEPDIIQERIEAALSAPPATSAGGLSHD